MIRVIGFLLVWVMSKCRKVYAEHSEHVTVICSLWRRYPQNGKGHGKWEEEVGKEEERDNISFHKFSL